MDPFSRPSDARVRSARLGAQPPSLAPGKQQPAAPRVARAALADVSNRDVNQYACEPPAKAPPHTAPALAPPTTTALASAPSVEAPAATGPSFAAVDAPVAVPAHAVPADVGPDVSMSADSYPGRGSAADTSAATPESEAYAYAGRDSDAGSAASDSARSGYTDELDALELDVDPAGVVTLPLEEELLAQQRADEICERYHANVLQPQMLAAAAERRDGRDAAHAAFDEEMARLGLDPEEVRDTSMVAEYANDIFAYMAQCERESMANPHYMDFQDEIQWHMRATLIDWLLQVHMRYHLLPETLWIAVNLVDRFLSARIVSLAKLQLVGVTAMFIAAKYEEILAPSVEEFVFMTENGYSRDEILRGERIVLTTLEFNVSTYCTPYSWVRRISKADDYDIQTRTLCKFLMEVTLLNHLFLRARPSLIAAIGMYLSKRMLGGVWDEAFVYYSHFVEEQLVPGANLVLEKLVEPGFEEQFVYKKYASKKFLKASIFARLWALRHHQALNAQEQDHNLAYAPERYNDAQRASDAPRA